MSQGRKRWVFGENTHMHDDITFDLLYAKLIPLFTL